MSQSFSLAANFRARHPLRQFEGMVVALDTVENHMPARHLLPDDTEEVDLQNAMTFIVPGPHQDHDLLFALAHTLDLAHHHRAEVALAQTRGITDAGAQATAAMATAVAVAVQTVTEAIIETKNREFLRSRVLLCICSALAMDCAWSSVRATEFISQDIQNS